MKVNNLLKIYKKKSKKANNLFKIYKRKLIKLFQIMNKLYILKKINKIIMKNFNNKIMKQKIKTTVKIQNLIFLQKNTKTFHQIKILFRKN